MIADFILVFSTAIIIVVSIAIVYFIFLFDSLLEEEVYESSYKAFMLLIVAFIVHGFYQGSILLFGYSNKSVFLEFLSMTTFITMVAILTMNAMRAQITIGVNRRLEYELNRRTAELKERTMELEESNNLKQLLIDILGHDLMNPLAAIKSVSEILLREKQDDSIKVIKQSTDRLIGMVKNTASLARLDNIHSLNLINMEIGKMLADVIESFKPLAAESNISIIFEDGENYPARANPLIKEIFNNLISNAIKYNKRDGKVMVEVFDEGDYWRVRVMDWGMGIADEHKEKIFRRFQRIKKEGIKGTGLGLAIAKKVTDLHGGKIWMEGNPEGGSIFNVTVPKAKV